MASNLAGQGPAGATLLRESAVRAKRTEGAASHCCGISISAASANAGSGALWCCVKMRWKLTNWARGRG